LTRLMIWSQLGLSAGFYLTSILTISKILPFSLISYIQSLLFLNVYSSLLDWNNPVKVNNLYNTHPTLNMSTFLSYYNFYLSKLSTSGAAYPVVPQLGNSLNYLPLKQDNPKSIILI